MSKFGNDVQMVDRLARAMHEIFVSELKSQGYRYGSMTSEVEKTHSSLVSFEELSEDEKEQNRNIVRDIPYKLGQLGYSLKPVFGDSKNKINDFQKEEIEQLAELEHERWLKLKVETGWQYASETDKVRKKHRDMVPWDQLNATAKEKDRVMIRSIPLIIQRAGYSMIRTV